jgi:hypothetical protein
MRVCLVLGAGATLANAAHFRARRQPQLLPPLDQTFFEKFAPLGIAIPTELRTYATTAFGSNPFDLKPGQSALRIEELFRELFSDFRVTPQAPGVARAYEQLVETYVRVLRQTTNWMADPPHHGGPIGRLIANAATAGDSLTIITFNHDLVIENEIVERARLRERWCLEQGYGAFSRSLRFGSVGQSNIFPLHGPQCDHTRPLQVLKLHGSLNWYVVMAGSHPTPGLLTGRRRVTIRCTRRRVVTHQLRYLRRRGAVTTRQFTWPVVIPPVHDKDALVDRLVPGVWADARDAVVTADRLAFVGYSMPALDVRSEILFRRGIAANLNLGWVDVVNPSAESAARYARIIAPKQLRWTPSIDAYIRLAF